MNLFQVVQFAVERPELALAFSTVFFALFLVIVGLIKEHALTLTRSAIEWVGQLLWSSVATTVRIPSDSNFFKDLEVWLKVRGTTQIVWRNRQFEQSQYENNRTFEMETMIRVGEGTQMLIRHQDWYLWMYRPSPVIEEGRVRNNKDAPLNLVTLGRDAGLIHHFIEEVRSYGKNRDAYLSQSPFLNIFVADPTEGDWVPYDMPHRPWESVILDETLEHTLLSTIEQWMQNADRCDQLGIPHRLGILLEGPPGSGKTTLAKALATKYGLELHHLHLGDPELTDDTMIHLLRAVGHFTTIVLIEDISALHLGRQDEEDDEFEERKRGITLSGLLNAIDGVLSPQHTMFVFTANNADGLDSALTRYGRIDLSLKVDHATPSQMYRVFRRFFPESEYEPMARMFADTLPPKALSMAEIQFQLAKNMYSPQGAVEWAKARRVQYTNEGE